MQTDDAARLALMKCCGSAAWVERMLERRPFRSTDEMLRAADDVWQHLTEDDWREAFTHHPKIGDLESLKKRFSGTAHFASIEQSGMAHASETLVRELAALNADYERKFGYIFIVCATGKSAEEMAQILKSRLMHSAAEEIKCAAAEQAKITRLRLDKMFNES